MNCSISGEVPEEPVVSKKSGHLFEKRLIERHILDYAKCPVTGEPLSMDDIVPIKAGKIVKPRPVQAASIPGMLGMFQIEWDGLMLSNYALEQQLHNARQELSHALYQHDAACRVIARLKRERDEARALLAQAERQIPMPMVTQDATNAAAISNGKRVAEDGEMAPEGKKIRPGVSSSIITELAECNSALSAQRKKRQIPSTLAPVDDLVRYTQLTVNPLHRTNKPGILSLDILLSKDIIATAGADSNVVVFDKPSGQAVSTLSGHTKRVTSVKFAAEGEFVVSGSADKTVRIWQSSEGDYSCRHILKDHKAEVQAVTVHATNKYFVSASLDHTWCFYDLASGLCLTQVEDASGSSEGYTSAAFHPDGLILATGTSGAAIKVWDVKSQANVATCEGHIGPVTAISFSENGYFLATAAQDGVKLWDLRKVKNFRNISPYDENTPTQTVDFDHSGSYLAFGGSDIRVHEVANVKSEWNCIKTFPDVSGTGKINCVKFGPDAKYIAVGSSDRNLRIFGKPEAEDVQSES